MGLSTATERSHPWNSLIIHPASTTHRQLEEEQQIKAGAAPNVVRISIGIEGVKDIIADLDQGLAAATA